jgi:hypothetical protein
LHQHRTGHLALAEAGQLEGAAELLDGLLMAAAGAIGGLVLSFSSAPPDVLVEALAPGLSVVLAAGLMAGVMRAGMAEPIRQGSP